LLICRKKEGHGAVRPLFVGWGAFEGVLGKAGGKTWCFGGVVVVVKCVVKLVRKQPLPRGVKVRHGFQVFFRRIGSFTNQVFLRRVLIAILASTKRVFALSLKCEAMESLQLRVMQSACEENRPSAAKAALYTNDLWHG
jgi:hypothetical protein